jgi:acetyl esterase/lipase
VITRHRILRHRILRLVLAALLFQLASWAQTPATAPQPATLEGASAHVYKTIQGTELRLHVFGAEPATPATRRPAIVFFFGGGWAVGSVAQFVPQARHLAQRGMVAVVADYRVFTRHRTSPFEAMADAKSALRWVRQHAAQLGVDPARIMASGGSSGGHLALAAAMFDAFDEPGEDRAVSSKPNALVLFNPALLTAHANAPALRQLFGERGQEASPLHHVGPGLPPTLILHGKADATVPYALAERFCAESKKAGNACELVGYEGAPHGFFNSQAAGGRWQEATLREMDRFLAALGYLSEAAAGH